MKVKRRCIFSFLGIYLPRCVFNSWILGCSGGCCDVEYDCNVVWNFGILEFWDLMA